MNPRLAEAQAALQSGDTAKAIDRLRAVLEADPDQPPHIWRLLLQQLYAAGLRAEGEAWSARAIQRHPGDPELRNARGIFLRLLRRFPEALAELEAGWELDRQNWAIRSNLANVLLDLGEGARAEQAFAGLLADSPADAELCRLLGRSLALQGRHEDAGAHYRQAIAMDPKAIEPRLDLASALRDQQRLEDARATLDEALAISPDDPRLIESMASLLMNSGDGPGAVAFLEGLQPRHEASAWLHRQLGQALHDIDARRSDFHLRRAVELDADDPRLQLPLIESLDRNLIGDEGARLDEAYQRLLSVMARQPLHEPAHVKIAMDVLIRVCDFERADDLGSFRDIGRLWAASGRHSALLKLLGRVRSHADRRELVEQHRIWGLQAEALAAANPIARPPARIRALGDKIRLGLMSSDLRHHPVSYFALPLFDHLDRERFEVFCYSWSQRPADPVQETIASRATAFRWTPGIAPRDAAQLIAADSLDMLIELGGTTHMNKVEALAWRPAPRQASWLGYPHSAGLEAIDWFVCDRFNAPTDPALLIEKPLVLPHCWISLGRAFSESIPIEAGLPEQRAGVLTFGTANNPHKYSREVLRTWARITAAVPGARFMFVRPEGGSASFRRHVLAEFAAEGVPEARVVFQAVRGGHLPYYGQIDITLDPFPLTGGTTTAEALWMGVPVVSLAGEAFYERLSYSILSNAGLADLSATSLEDYERIALALAADRERRRDLRHGMRTRLKASPLGQAEGFARDFYDAIAKVVETT
jgi:predicted O-linked N-acetylglucosamine transferase (SPINDLY family)